MTPEDKHKIRELVTRLANDVAVDISKYLSGLYTTEQLEFQMSDNAARTYVEIVFIIDGYKDD